MEQIITNNLFRFWELVGQKADKLERHTGFNVIHIQGSDWPNRVFALSQKESEVLLTFGKIIQGMKKGLFPNLMTISGPTSFLQEELAGTEIFPLFSQMGMALDLKKTEKGESENELNFKLVRSLEEVGLFAQIASSSFGYKVDPSMLTPLLTVSDQVKMFVGYHLGKPASCGLIFYDDRGHSGLHMIGTLPTYRGMGLGSDITKRLIKECAKDRKKICVLHASEAGEKMYRKLGFVPYNQIITYTLDGESVRYPWKRGGVQQEEAFVKE